MTQNKLNKNMGSLLSSDLNSSCGIDSIQSIDNILTDMIFPNQDPLTNSEIMAINNVPNNTLTYVKSRTDNMISMLEVRPTNPKGCAKCGSGNIIIYSHGNGENLDTVQSFLYWLANTYSVIAISYDYIGYGASKGRPSEEGCYEAANTIINHVCELNPTKNVLLIGLSLGTGVVMEYISQTGWTKPVLLMAAYKSIPRVLSDTSLTRLFLMHNNFDSINKIHKTKCPILFMHGKSDELIKWQHTRDLHNALPNKKFDPIYYENAGHNDLYNKITMNVIHTLFSNF